MLVEANETFLKKDKALVGRSLVQASKNVFVRVMPAFDLKQSKPIIPSTVICATNACTTISFVSSSLIRKLPRPIIKIHKLIRKVRMLDVVAEEQDHLGVM
jgi:hypothetical protein